MTKRTGSRCLSLQHLSLSFRTSKPSLRKRGKYQSDIENGKRRVYVELNGIRPSFDNPDHNQLADELRRQVEYLQGKFDERDRQVQRLEREFNERVQQLTTELSEARQSTDDASKRSDMLMAQLTQQVDRAQFQLEDLPNQQKPPQKQGRWDRMFGSKG